MRTVIGKMKPKKNTGKTFIDLHIALALPRLLSNKLRKAGVSCTFRHLEDVLSHPGMTPALAKALANAVEGIVKRRGLKQLRNGSSPNKIPITQFTT